MIEALKISASDLWCFLVSVSPELFVTVVALVLGIPFALWTDRRMKEREARKAEADDSVRLNRALTVLATSLNNNQGEFLRIAQALAADQARISPSLDYSGWEACKLEIIPLLHDPELQRRFAFYFSRIEAFLRINQMYLDYFIGVASALGDANNSRETLKKYLASATGELAADTAKLIKEVEDAKRPEPART